MFDLDSYHRDANELNARLQTIIGMEIDPATLQKLFLTALGEDVLRLYNIALYYAQEADKCRASGSYFPCCLMLASALETLLAMMCFLQKSEVEATAAYSRLNRERDFKSRIGQIRLENLIETAIELNWIPKSAVDDELFSAAIQDYPFVLTGLYPQLNKEEHEKKFSNFSSQPGIEMLRVLQDLRNLVHGPRCSRLRVRVNDPAFESDCKFVFVIGNQVMYCLFATITALGSKRMVDLDRMIESMPEEVRVQFRTQLERLISQVSRQ